MRDAVRELSGFEARFSHFPIVGLCPKCARKQKSRAKRANGGAASLTGAPEQGTRRARGTSPEPLRG